MKKSVATESLPKPLIDKEAAELMWVYYKQHKEELMTDIKEYRDYILAELAKGVSPEKVFAQFARQPEPAAPVRRGR